MEELIDQFHLPKYVKGKSFADASSMIMDKFRERKDPESKRTMTEMLDRLRQAQEFVKEQNKTPEERQQEQMQMQEQQMQQEQPQDVNPQMEEQMMQEQPQQQIQQTQFAEGGLMGYMKENAGGIASAGAGTMNMIGDLSGEGVSTNTATAGLTGAAKGAMAGAALGPIGMAGGAVLGGITSLIGSGKAKREMLEKEQNETQLGRNQALNTFALGGSINPDPKYPQNPNQLISSFKNNQEGLNYANPYPNRSDRWNTFNNYQQGLNSRSSGISFEGSNNKRKGFNSGMNLDTGSGINLNGKQITDEQLKSKLNARPRIDYNVQNKALIQQSLNSNVASNTFSKGGQMTNQYALGDWLKTAGKNIGTAAAKTGQFLNENKGDILRYAPTAINAFQLAKLPKAEVESLNKLDNRYKPGYVDEAALQNTARENYNMTSQALSGASGGSTSALRSNILGAGLNRNKALSDAYLKSSDINRGEDARAQQFNLGVDRVNLQQSNSEKDINARNRAARDNEKSKLLSGIGTDIGEIGKEEKYKDIIEKISGYNQKGELKNKKKPKVKTIAPKAKGIVKANTTLYDKAPKLNFKLNR